MNKIKLTIIIPVYNVELYLQECLDSLLYSMHKNKEVEVILIDDGSTDKSYTICQKYEAKYSFIKLIKQKNSGQSVARNNAINKAKGTWISFIDSDDIVINNYISILFNIINSPITDDADMVMFKYKTFKENVPKYNQSQNQFNKDKLKKIDKNKAMYLLTALNYWGNYLWNKIYKKEVLLNNLLPVGKKYEDIGTLYKYVFNSKQVYIYDDVLYYYRQRERSTVHTRSLKMGMDELEARQNQLTFFKVHNYLKAYKRAGRYFMASCVGLISDFPGSKLYYLSLKCIKKYNVSIKNDGLKTWIKVWIVKFNPKVWLFIKKIKSQIDN